MTDYVIDASVAVKWFVQEPESDAAERLLAFDGKLAAPRILMNEVASGLWKNYFRDRIGRETLFASLGQTERVIEAWYDDAPLLQTAMEMALDLPHHIYDCIYLALARQLGTSCITSDKKLLRLAPKELAIALSDWKP